MRAVEVIIPFFIAGLGTCFAGILLDHVQYWDVFKDIEELFLVLPAILGLKGNLQMTLASRFSTHSHLGHLQTTEDLFGLTCANIALNQCLSIVISSCASLLVTVIQLIITMSTFNAKNTLLIFATTLLASSVTSFALDLLMILVVQVSASMEINPDNVATPIASSLGDMTALMLTSIIGSNLYSLMNTPAFFWITSVVILFYSFLVPIWLNVAQENVHTHNVLTEISYWTPLLIAMILSTFSGIILRSTIFENNDIALFLPVMCGIGGNMAAVQASRLSSQLHKFSEAGELPEGESVCMNPINLITSPNRGYSTSRLLLLLVIPGQIVFYFICVFVNGDTWEPSGPFLMLYILGSETQVILLIYLAYVITYLMWRHGMDPDNSAIPYLTSISDVLGAIIITVICSLETPTVIHEEGALNTN